MDAQPKGGTNPPFSSGSSGSDSSLLPLSLSLLLSSPVSSSDCSSVIPVSVGALVVVIVSTFSFPSSRVSNSK